MKVVGIFRGNREIERISLEKPLMLVGRSPTNDLVLRAPGVAPVHFLIEWVGVGEFDPMQDQWSIVNVSNQGATAETPEEGLVLSDEAVVIDGFRFELRDDRIATASEIGGQVSQKIEGDFATPGVGRGTKELLLESFLIRKDSKAIEDVSHVPVSDLRNERVLFGKLAPIKVGWSVDHVKFSFGKSQPEAVFNRSTRLESTGALSLKTSDFVKVEWEAFEAYFRLVERQKVAVAERSVMGDPLLRTLFFACFVAFLGLVALASRVASKAPDPKLHVPLRIATVEIKEVRETLPPPPPEKEVPPPAKPVQEVAKSVEKPVEKIAPKKSEPLKIGTRNLKINDKPAEAAVPKFVKQAQNPGKNVGLNNAAKVTDTNQVGILGAFGKARKGPGVNADLLLNQGTASNTVSGTDQNASIMVKNPPSGTIGEGKGGDPNGTAAGNDLVEAQTSFGGGDSYNPSSTGPISRKGAKGKGWQPGSGLEAGGSGLANGDLGGTSDLGALDGGLSVQGGLDADTVRKVIAANRSKIRTCYDRALMSKKGLAGRIVCRWRISPSGGVTTAEVVKSTVESTSLEACVLEVIKEMVFPKSENGQPTLVNYPYVFKSRD